MPPVRAKGTTFISTIRYFQDKFGPAGYEKICAALPEAGRAQAKSGYLASVWYPFADLIALMKSAQKEFGQTDPKLLWNSGRASADYGINTVYKIFMKVGSPEFMISKALTVFANYYDQGKFVMTVSEPRHAIGEIRDFPEPSAEFCQRLQGFFERTLEITGATRIELSHPECKARGSQVCRFEARWVI